MHINTHTCSLTHTDDIDARLRHTSNLLSELQKQQNERLSLPPVKNTEGHMVLSGPSHEETNTVQDIRTELASLTAQVGRDWG